MNMLNRIKSTICTESKKPLPILSFPCVQYMYITVREPETMRLLRCCGDFKNYIPSSGCDISPNVDLDNVNAFFNTVEGYRKSLRNAIA